jgi:hypothetical protein
MKVALSYNAKNVVFGALAALDGFEAITPGVERGARAVRVPYKLGAQRRVLVKNMAALKASLGLFNEAKQAIVAEVWPDKPEGVEYTEKDDPANFARFKAEMAKMIATKEEIELEALPASLLYGDQEFPAEALLALEENHLIADAA